MRNKQKMPEKWRTKTGREKERGEGIAGEIRQPERQSGLKCGLTARRNEMREEPGEPVR